MTKDRDWGHSLVTECLPSMLETDPCITKSRPTAEGNMKSRITPSVIVKGGGGLPHNFSGSIIELILSKSGVYCM